MTPAESLRSNKPFLTFGGVETYLVFQREVALREFSAFEILDNEPELANLEAAFLRPTFDAARRAGFGVLCDCFVWRAAPDWLAKLGYDAGDLERINRNAVAWMRGAVARWRADTGASAADVPVLLAGEIGPRGDGYALGGDQPVPPDVAAAYHDDQMRALVGADTDVVCALTMTSATETVGIARAARQHGVPLIVSPTVETDGRLPDGGSLGDLIAAVDDATGGYPLLYMVNCAHPQHLEPTLTAAGERGESWLQRFRGLRANASTKSHEELDNSTELDAGDPPDLARRLADLRQRFDLTILGGCCGTDATHIEAIAATCG